MRGENLPEEQRKFENDVRDVKDGQEPFVLIVLQFQIVAHPSEFRIPYVSSIEESKHVLRIAQLQLLFDTENDAFALQSTKNSGIMFESSLRRTRPSATASYWTGDCMSNASSESPERSGIGLLSHHECKQS